jgi:hypothetical protein
MNKNITCGSIILAALYSCSVIASDGVPLSDVSQTLLVGGGVLTKLMWAVCIVVGIALIAAAFTQFQIHRRNPKLVPLTTPVLYLILGIVAIAIPFVSQIKGFLTEGQPGINNSSARSNYNPHNSNVNNNPNDIDAPLY